MRGRLWRERSLRGPFTVALRARLTRHKAGSALSRTRGEADTAAHRVNPKARRYEVIFAAPSRFAPAPFTCPATIADHPR